MNFQVSLIEFLSEYILRKKFLKERTNIKEEITYNLSKEVWKQGDQIMAKVIVTLIAGYEIDSIIKLFTELANHLV